MKEITFKAVKNGRGYVETAYAPGSRSRAGGNNWELLIAGGLLVMTAAFVCLMLLAI